MPLNAEKAAAELDTSTSSSSSSNLLPAPNQVPRHDAAVESAAAASASASASASEEMLSKRRKEIFGDCALIEIIHLHDCLRGALKALEEDVNALAQVVGSVQKSITSDKKTSSTTSDDDGEQARIIADLERRVAGRFKVIWSVFKSHSQAEDEFIWPALKTKTQGQVTGASSSSSSSSVLANNKANNTTNTSATTSNTAGNSAQEIIEQEEYEEDHADEERMFSEMDALLKKLRDTILVQQRQSKDATFCSSNNNNNNNNLHQRVVVPISDMTKAICEHTQHLSEHLMTHLEKEETQCMPLVIKHLSKAEIHDLVGNIMGKRSADTIAQIMTMAVQNLDQAEQEEMVKYMKQSMAGTFFDRWLTMSGWLSNEKQQPAKDAAAVVAQQQQHQPQEQAELLGNSGAAVAVADGRAVHDGEDDRKRPALLPAEPENPAELNNHNYNKRVKAAAGEEDQQDIISHVTDPSITIPPASAAAASSREQTSGVSTTSQAELEKLIRAIASNNALTPAQKNTTIQGLRDSVWKSNQRQKELSIEQPPTVVNVTVRPAPNFLPPPPPSVVAPVDTSTSGGVSSTATSTGGATSCRTRRNPPSMYFKKTQEGKIETVWTSDSSSHHSSMMMASGGGVPLFSAAELAPTYHDGAAGSVLGCIHYSRACKLRHPKSGRLYTCRLCCEQQRELPMKDQDEPLDRYAVTEVMCMKCNALQPAEDRCFNPDCESRAKPFAKYFCRICHLYDDGSRPIFHCPYCNTCRLGLGLGIDFRHCMRCNACVSLSDTDHHCIPQKLQGSCPICHESLFQSTDPLRGLKCGHVMHLSCFTEYRRGHSYTCPLCMRSMEDMKDYFSLLDTAVRMQPMPLAYLSTMSNIYCQDCGETGQTRYHFVGQKCPKCGSYNTRELGRVHNSPSTSPRTTTGN